MSQWQCRVYLLVVTFHRKNLLELLVFQSIEPQLDRQKIVNPVRRENASTSTSTNFQFQQSKKRKLNLAPIRFDNDKTTEVKFDLAKYTAKVRHKCVHYVPTLHKYNNYDGRMYTWKTITK